MSDLAENQTVFDKVNSWLKSLLHMVFSNILENQGKTVTVWKLPKSFSSPALKIVVILAVFKSSGKISSYKDNLKVY